MTEDDLTGLLPPAGPRRARLIEHMAELERQGIHCFSCSGVCCTALANSMMTTPLETLELAHYLKSEGRIDETLRTRLHHCIRRYRLDREPPGDGRRGFLRRTYTCPFLEPGPRGCSLSRSIKPYGCLGFNPHRANQTEGGDCAANGELLTGREDQYATTEEPVNRRIRAELELDWEKKPMPTALLEVIDRLDWW